MQKIAILSDFDGTITREIAMRKLYVSFAAPDYINKIQLWKSGKMSSKDLIPAIFSTMKATKSEMESVLDLVEIDNSLSKLVDFCRTNNFIFAIVSDGLRWYIEYILKRHRFDNIPIYAGEIEFTSSGYKFSFPWFSNETPLYNTSKSSIIKQYRDNGYKVVFIGDGVTDFQAAEFADTVFAKDELLGYCKKQNVKCYEYYSINDLVEKLDSSILKRY